MPRDDDSQPARLRTLDSALEIEEFEDVTLLLKNPIEPKRRWWSRLTSFFTFGSRRSWRSGFQRLETNEDTPVRPQGRWCPEEDAGFFSRHFYCYINSLIDMGMKKHLVKEDLWDLSARDETRTVTRRYDQNLEESKDAVMRPQGSVFKALWWTFGRLFLFAGLVKVIHDLFQIMGPELLRQLLIHLRDKESAAVYYEVGVGLAIALFLVSASQTLLINYYFHILYRMSLHIKSSLVQMLYAKSLRISSAARSEFGIGKIVNLQSNDASKLWDLVIFLHVIWSAPFQIFLVLFRLIDILGWVPAMGGLIVIIALIPVTTFIGKTMAKMRKEQMKFTDARVKATSEVVTGIKAIKLYAWEDSYIKKIQDLRETELLKILRIGFLRAFSRVVYMISPILVSGVAFGLYVWQGKHFTADVAFPALAFFNLLRFPVTMLPNQIMNIVNGSVALKRIQGFMDSEEMQKETSGQEENGEPVVSVKEGTFSWPPNPEAILSGIQFDVQKGKLLQIVGDVGCGKSSLLSALMGEMKKHSGTVYVNGSVAYTSQEPWIQNKTLQDNILMDRELDDMRYIETVEACALMADLEALPGGDQTEIGEKGVNLSGGQKHRVALARACYSDADIYFLDDPLSAVDAHVGRHLFEKCICGLLDGKTRILVSHQLQFLPHADLIMVMKLGKIVDIGTYEGLLQKGIQFSEFDLHHSHSLASITEAAASPKSSSSDDGIEDLNNKPEGDGVSKKSGQKKLVSSKSLDRLTSLEAKKKGKLTGDEDRAVGRVKRNIYTTYVKAWGPVFIMPILLIMSHIGEKGFAVTQNWWLAGWTNEADDARRLNEDINSVFYLTVYYVFGGLSILSSFMGTIVLLFSSIGASRKLYSQLVLKVARLPMSFFDSQPAGRLLNRFTKDTESMDSEVAGVLAMALGCIISVLFSLIIVTAVTKVVIVAIVILAVLYFRIQRRYVATTREIKRLDALGLSPIFSHFNESLQGLQTIRAFRREPQFLKTNEGLIDQSNRAKWPLYAINRWLSVRLDIMSAFIVFITAIVVTALLSADAGMAGLALTSALNLTGLMNWLIRMTTQLEVIMNSIERITEYKKYDTEKAAIVDSNRPPNNWPHGGSIVVKNIWVKYREETDPVLKGVSFTIFPHEKIGVCGRTGSGKSTLMMALYRLVEPFNGTVHIDDINVLEIGLYDLRSKLSLVPQDPVIFSGTVRSNLDPMSELSSDAYIWHALRQVGLHDFVAELQGQLDAEVSEGGQNLSVGQRQLLCMARALLRGSKVLILDEATSNVDNATDSVIQTTIRSAFQDCTVLTIAHRLHTIIDYDRVMVLDDGHIAEFDTPQNLLSRPESMFAHLVQEAGKKGKARRTKSSIEFLNKVDQMMKE